MSELSETLYFVLSVNSPNEAFELPSKLNDHAETLEVEVSSPCHFSIVPLLFGIPH
ncbi:MAG: hypothetical protein IKO39_04415 [Treponema sp.]|nr:hypothetical protein [Treponema sp.]